jgi:hypothetical protein
MRTGSYTASVWVSAGRLNDSKMKDDKSFKPFV